MRAEIFATFMKKCGKERRNRYEKRFGYDVISGDGQHLSYRGNFLQNDRRGMPGWCNTGAAAGEKLRRTGISGESNEGKDNHRPLSDSTDVAIACDAAGVHVGSSDLPVAVARKLHGPDKIVGATAKTVEAAKKAYEDGADYLGVGAIFPTTTKVVTIRTSVETLNEICQSVPIPAVAIGGLNDGNMDILKGGKMAGVAVVSAIMKAEDPKAAAARLKEHVGELRG